MKKQIQNLAKTGKSIRYFLVLFISVLSVSLFAQSADIEVSPADPVVNESFFITFKVRSSGNQEPYITFDPVNAEVLGRREVGGSINTVIQNGKFTTTREQVYVYELISDRATTAFLKNIQVDINGKVEKLKDVRINISSERKKAPDAFLEAVPSKTKIYIGEGINVNYYLYYKVPVVFQDVKEFPKLNKFIKRFYKTNQSVETVQYRGEVYRRVLAYSARAFPEKVGTAVLDPMKISAQVADQRSYHPFGGLTSSYKLKDISSARVEIEVMQIPTESMPTNFTGLVGSHEINLSGGKDKYLVNEPIEFKFEVKGSGALENYQASALISGESVEEFDTKSDLVEIENGLANKKFEFTYLARNEVSIPEREIALSFFDPEKKSFYEKKVKVPSIKVSGGTFDAPVASIPKKNEAKPKDLQSFDFSFIPNWLISPKKSKSTQLGLVTVQEKLKPPLQDVLLYTLSIIMGLISIFFISNHYFGNRTIKASEDDFNFAFKQFKKKPSYESYYSLLLASMNNKSKNVKGNIEDSSLPINVKNYLISLLDQFEKDQFSKDAKPVKVKIDYSKVKKIKSLLDKENEDY